MNVSLKTSDGRERRPNLLFIEFGVLAIIRLKPWSTRGESHLLWETFVMQLLCTTFAIQLLWATGRLLFTDF